MIPLSKRTTCSKEMLADSTLFVALVGISSQWLNYS